MISIKLFLLAIIHLINDFLLLVLAIILNVEGSILIVLTHICLAKLSYNCCHYGYLLKIRFVSSKVKKVIRQGRLQI